LNVWTENSSHYFENDNFMSKRLGLIMLMVLLVCASSTVVSASDQKDSVAVNGSYVVKAAQGSDISAMTVSSTITQGTTNWHTKSVTSFITTLNVDLRWGNPSNSLRLKIYSPDGYVFGPYYDSFDGNTDGRINLNIVNANGIARGTWYYEVYGDQVAGTQAYSL
jgi:hypothetical protein